MSEIYPNLETICRLCLEENAGVVEIFPKHNATGSNISISMRLMACAALEVQNIGDMPNKICNSCRFQLEKAYYFRKRSQASDVKLRKHLRLLSMGKKSKVFDKHNESDDDDDNELEFKDSLDFIKTREQEIAQLEEEKFEMYKKQIKLETEEFLKAMKATLENEMTPVIRNKLKDECLEEAKRIVYEEIRQKEIKNLLSELEDFFTHKKNSLQILTKDQGKAFENSDEIKKTKKHKGKELKVLRSKINGKKHAICSVEPIKENLNFKNGTAKSTCEENVDKQCMFECEQNKTESNDDLSNITYNGIDENLLSIMQDSNDTDSTGCKALINVNSNELMKMNIKLPLTDGEEDDFYADSTEEPQQNTTSYQIKDDDNGEITLLKKTPPSNSAADQCNGGNVIIIDITEDVLENTNLVNNRKEEDNECTTKETKTTTAVIIHANTISKTYSNTKQRVTDTAKIFKCSDCPMEFSLQNALERHVRAHRKSQETGITYECSQCHYVLSCRSALQRHMNIHSEEKPFVCRECGKGFVQKEILKRHTLIHTGIKPHQCTHCDKAFTQRISLTQHINRHHAETQLIKQYNCPLCPKTFFHASGLSRHLATHSGVAYQCTECERTFGDRSSIKRHIANIHGKGSMSKTNIINS